MNIFQLREFLNEELRSATDEPRYHLLDSAINCLDSIEAENEALREALEEVHESAAYMRT